MKVLFTVRREIGAPVVGISSANPRLEIPNIDEYKFEFENSQVGSLSDN